MKDNASILKEGYSDYLDPNYEDDYEIGDIDQPRPEIASFAYEMERVMSRHDKEDGDTWKQCPAINFSHLITAHAKLLSKSFQANDKESIRHECIDIANFAMMIFNLNA